MHMRARSCIYMHAVAARMLANFAILIALQICKIALRMRAAAAAVHVACAHACKFAALHAS